MALSYDEKLGIGSGIARGFEKAMTNIYNIKQAQAKTAQEKEMFDLDVKIKKTTLEQAKLSGAVAPQQYELQKLQLDTAIKAHKQLAKNQQIVQDDQLDKNMQQAKTTSTILENNFTRKQVIGPKGGITTTIEPKEFGKTLEDKLELERGKEEIKQEFSTVNLGTAEGLDSKQQLHARKLARKLAGVRGAEKILPSIYAEMKAGKSIDTIEDEIRFSGQSEGFAGDVRNAVQSIMINADEGKTQRSMDYIDDLYSEGSVPEAKEQIKRLARKQAGTEEERSINGKERTVKLIDEIQDDLDTLEANGINTNIFTGSVENINSRIGKVNNPAMRQIATKIAVAVQNYRRSMSGVAFSVPESEEYKKIFPSISKTANFNKSNVDALRDVIGGDLDTFYSLSMGQQTYDSLFKEDQIPEFQSEEEAIQSGTKGIVMINGRKAEIT